MSDEGGIVIEETQTQNISFHIGICENEHMSYINMN